jgi:hypothetical protein
MDSSVKMLCLLLWLRWLFLLILFIMIMAVYSSASEHSMTATVGYARCGAAQISTTMT